MDLTQFEGRKREHIQQSLNPANQALGQSRLDQIRLVHEALPDTNFEDLSLETELLGRRMPTPFYVAGMTAGHPDAPKLNETLARACQRRGWAMGVGSQRRELEANALLSSGAPGANPPPKVDEWKRLREVCPDLVLMANLGISQITTARLEDIQKVVRDLDAQVLAVHTNALQEALQPEGTPHFRDSLAALRRLCIEMGSPVMLKETGCGFSASSLARVRDFGLAAVDVSGLGGTHWGRIEGARAEPGSRFQVGAQTFGNWGESTVDSVLAGAKVFGPAVTRRTRIWASGGVRSGLDAAKLIALGADRVGYAKPALEAALAGPEALDRWMDQMEFELRVAVFCTGCKSLDELRSREGLWKTET